MSFQALKRFYPSYIGLYDACPKRYQLVRILRYRAEKHKKATFGEVVHAHIADYYRYFPQDQIDQETIDKLIQDMYKSNQLMFEKQERKDYKIILQNFKKFELERLEKHGKENFLPLFIEKEVRADYVLEDGEIELAVIIDVGFPNKLVVDWKTGKNRSYSKIQSGVIQYVLDKNNFSSENLLFAFLYSGQYLLADSEDVKHALEIIDRFVEGLRAKSFPMKQSEFCKICGFRAYCFEGEEVNKDHIIEWISMT